MPSAPSERMRASGKAADPRLAWQRVQVHVDPDAVFPGPLDLKERTSGGSAQEGGTRDLNYASTHRLEEVAEHAS